jgi:hypothetical protein
MVPLIGNKPPLRTGADGVMISRVSVCGAEKSQLKESTVFERMDWEKDWLSRDTESELRAVESTLC